MRVLLLALRRLAASVPTLLLILAGLFLLLQLAPGDTVDALMAQMGGGDAALAEELRRFYGLDLPVMARLGDYLWRLVRLDLGFSAIYGKPVATVILERLPATLTLALASIVVALLIALPLGTLSALHPRSAVDRVATVLSQAGISIPDFWLGIVLILLFAGTLGWLPSGGYVPLTEDPLGWLQRLVMPAVVTGIVSGSVITRFVRSSVLEALGSDHVRTAQAKGLPSRQVLSWHVLRNALLPLVTVIGVQLAYLLSGVVVTEIVFAWPGLGQLALQAVQARDYPVLQGAILLFALVFLLVNLVVDLLYGRLDPRIARR